MSRRARVLGLVCAAALCLPLDSGLAEENQDQIGIFDGRTDVGELVIPGAASYDATAGSYTLTAAGENMWYAQDAFYFLWKKVSGDVELTADVAFPRPGGRAHRKAVLILKQDLAADGVYADVALHGSGLSALQYRRAKGATSQDIELNIDFPKTARIVKRGDWITMFLSMHGEALHQSGASIRLHLDAPFYVGIGLCSHDKDVAETAVFSRVELKEPEPPAAAEKPVVFSSVQTIQTEDRFRRSMMVRTERGRIGSVNWSADGQTLYFNHDGRMEKMPALGAEPQIVKIEAHLWCDDNHGLSPDNSQLAVSCAPDPAGKPSIYVLPLAGGPARRLTHDVGAAEFHGWSPDAATIAFTGVRDGHSDVYLVPSQGGMEMRLTDAGSNDGPDFSPDGNIYFSSDRSGSMQIWRMRPDGTQLEQLTHDEGSDWFPHVAPNGKQIVYLNRSASAPVGAASLRLMDLGNGQTRVLVDVSGGDGTLNAPSWSPDNHHFAFTEYDLLPRRADGPAYVMVPPKPDVPVTK